MALSRSDPARSSSEFVRRNEFRRALTDAKLDYTVWTSGELRPLAPASEGSNVDIQTALQDVTITSQTTADYSFLQPASTRVVNPVVTQSVPIERPDSFVALQSWEGHVLELNGDGFVARLSDKTASRPDEEAEFPKDEVSAIDRDLIGPGAIFYWSVGYRDRPNGVRSRESVIRFRRLPAWTDRELSDARDRARELYDRLAAE